MSSFNAFFGPTPNNVASLLHQSHFPDLIVCYSQAIEHDGIQDSDSARCERAHRQFFLPGNSELPDDEHIERSVEEVSYFKGDWDAAAGQTYDDDIIAVSELAKPGNKDSAGFESVLKQHRKMRRCSSHSWHRLRTLPNFVIRHSGAIVVKFG